MAIKTLALTLAVLFAGATQATELPPSFFGENADAKFTIDYTDLNELLKASVLAEVAPSRFNMKPTEIPAVNRAVTIGNNLTALSASRFFYEAYTDNPQMKNVLRNIRLDLEQLPDTKALNHFSKNEQLAYWLNLYNVTVLDELIRIYPQKDLQNVISGEDSLLNKKLLTVAGVALSLNDIQFEILPRQFPGETVVLYGLYQGVISSPNLQPAAYTGENVYQLLTQNAKDFVNSNRGTRAYSSLTFRVSDFYQRSASYFPDFEKDLRSHLAQFINAEEQDELRDTPNLVANLSDYTVTDLYGTASKHDTQFGISGTELKVTDAQGQPIKLSGKQLQQLYWLKHRNQTVSTEAKANSKEQPLDQPKQI